MLNLVLSDGRIGTFAEVNELNKQALFALRFQRSPEEFSTFHEDHPTIFDFNLPVRQQIPYPEPLLNRLSLAKIRMGQEGVVPNGALPTLPQNLPPDLSQNLNNNAAEALNTHLPSGVSLLDLSAGLYSSDSAVREMSSRVLFQLMVEADYLKYPWFSATRPKRKPEGERFEDYATPADVLFFENLLQERSKFGET